MPQVFKPYSREQISEYITGEKLGFRQYLLEIRRKFCGQVMQDPSIMNRFAPAGDDQADIILSWTVACISENRRLKT